jgi:uncharacterized membrane protein required for colicin V production
MNIIDILAGGLIAVGTVHGLMRGLSGELSALLSVLVAFIFTAWFHSPLALWMVTHTRLDERGAQTLAFVTTIVTALVILLLVRFGLRRIMRVVIEEQFDRVGGAIAGCFRAIMVTVIIFMVMNLWPHPYLNQKFGEESLVGALIAPHIPFILEKTGQAEE